MKKLIAIITVISIFIMSIPVYSSDVSDETKQMLALVKTRIGNTDEYGKMGSSITDEENGKTYNFTWESDGKSLYVSVMENGVITYYNKYDRSKNTNVKANINRKTTAEMMPTAQELLKKLNPDIYDELKITYDADSDSIYNKDYYYDIQRYVSNIPVDMDCGRFSVKYDGSEIIYLRLSYNPNLKFASSENAIGLDEAKTAFKEKMGMKLVYGSKWENKKRVPYLVYTLREPYNKYISAHTGEVVSPIYPIASYNGYSRAGGGGGAPASAETDFTPAETEELQNLSDVISKDEADSLIRSNPIINIDDGYTLNSVRLYKTYEDKKNYNLYYTGDSKYFYTSIDAKTGDILSFYKFSEYSEEKILTDEQALEIAENAKNALIPDYAKDVLILDYSSEYKLNPDSENGYISYTRYVHDIPYETDRITVNVDMATGEVISYSMNYSDTEFPYPYNIITEEEACDKLFEQTDYNLIYIQTCSAENMKYYDDTLLVYTFDIIRNCKINPYNGKLYNSYEPKEKTEPAEYTDISGHYGEDAIKALRRLGIGFDTSEFHPDESITAYDFILLLSSAMYNNNLGVVSTAERNNIDTGLLYEPLSRENACVIMIKILGYDEIASLDGIYNRPFSDVTENIGHISILKGMNVVKGDGNGNFDPDTELSRADSAIMIYNYLCFVSQ